MNQQQTPVLRELVVSCWDGLCSPEQAVVVVTGVMGSGRDVWDSSGGSGGCTVFSGAGRPWEMPPRHQSQGLEEGVQVGPGASKGEAGDQMD